MMIIVILSLFSVTKIVTVVNAGEDRALHNSNIIIDITEMFEKSTEGATVLLEDLLPPGYSNGNLSRLSYYFETDLDELALDKIQRVSKFVVKLTTQADFKSDFLPSITFSFRQHDGPMVPSNLDKAHLTSSSPSILQEMECLPVTLKLTIESASKRHSNPCNSVANYPHLNWLSLLKSIYQRQANCTGEIQVGYTMTKNMLQCQNVVDDMLQAEFIVYKFNLELDSNVLESYGAFKRLLVSQFEHLNLLLSQKANVKSMVTYYFQYNDIKLYYVPDYVSEEEIVTSYLVKLPLKVDQEKSRLLITASKYLCIFYKFVNEWSLSENKPTIVNPPEDSKSCSILKISETKKLLVPDITELFDVYDIGCNTSWRSVLVNLNNLAGQGFQSVMLKIVPWFKLLDYMHSCSNHTTMKITDQQKLISINANIFLDDVRMDDVLNMFAIWNRHSINQSVMFNDGKSTYVIKGQKFTIDLDFRIRGRTPRLNYMKALRAQTRFSCFKRIGLIEVKLLNITDYENVFDTVSIQLERYVSNSLEILNLCDEVILIPDLRTSRINLFLNDVYRDNFFKTLKHRFFILVGMLKKRWPEKKVTLSIEKLVYETQIGLQDAKDTLYCNPTAARLAEYFETLFTWAEVYEIPVIINDFMEARFKSPVSWIKLMPYSDVLPGVGEKFPLFLRRSYNTSKMFGKWSSGMLPCINWIDEVPTSRECFEGSSTGTYFNLNLREKNAEVGHHEMSTMLVFAMSMFQLIDIQVDNEKEMISAFEVLTHADFHFMLKENFIKKREILLCLQMNGFTNQTSSLLERGMKNVSMFKHLFTVSFHYSLPRTKSHLKVPAIDYVPLEHIKFESDSEIGIELKDCATLVTRLGTENMDNHRTTTNASYNMIQNLSYVVCVMPHRSKLASNRIEMQRYLETHYYMKRILQIFFPNLKNVYFKMLPDQLSSSDAKEVLVLFSQMAEYSKHYNISYILLPAFVPKNSNEFSWWKISNYTDLLNVEGYTDVYSEYLQRPSWRPILVEKINPVAYIIKDPIISEESNNTPWMVIGYAVTLLLFVCIIFGIVVKARKNAKLLSDEEVKEFLKGRQFATLTRHASQISSNKQEHSEYKHQYEIPKIDILLDQCTILGVGNFGIVYKARISPSLRSVAVKMPRQGCDKQSFIGMLREVKLLGYLGSHPNVIGFIGCYTKEIQNGVLYNVMELCTGGSLLAHLRNIKTKQKTLGPEAIGVNLVQFCHEIASGMEYVAKKHIVHGDLSARNILLNEVNVCKISDFGLSRKLQEYRVYSKKTHEPMPWRWMSYESLASMEFSTMSDVWSFGVTAWEIFSLGDVPYPGLSWISDFVQEMKNGMRLSSPPHATSQIHETVSKCWNLEPEQRPQFAELVTFFGSLLHYTDVL